MAQKQGTRPGESDEFRDFILAENEQKLVNSGKFEVRKGSVTFSDPLRKRLLYYFPERSIEESLRAEGVDPELVGQRRIKALESIFRDIPVNDLFGAATGYWPVDTRTAMRAHPHIMWVSQKSVVFSATFARGCVLLREQDVSPDRIREIFEFPEEWFGKRFYFQVYSAVRRAQETGEKPQFLELREFVPEAWEQVVRIQMNLVLELENCTNKSFAELKEGLHTLDRFGKKQFCEALRDDRELFPNWPRARDDILRGVGISRSNYYSLLSDEDCEKASAEKRQRHEKDLEDVRTVVESGGFEKGSRQVYMQMEGLTGRTMGRGKILKLMREADLKCEVRKRNPSREGSRNYMKENVKPNLVKRRFRLHRPGEVFLTDVTYMDYGEGKRAYGSALVDAVTGELTEFQLSSNNDIELAVKTVQAVPEGNPDTQIVVHSDQGSVYLSNDYQAKVAKLGFAQSMSKRGNCQDNYEMRFCMREDSPSSLVV